MESNAQAHVNDINLTVQPTVAASIDTANVAQHSAMHNYHHGHKLGSFIAHHWCRILVWVALIIATGFLIYLFYITAELQERHVDVSIIEVGQHYRCRGTNGCGPNCPFIARDDPRAEIKQHATQVDTILTKMREMQKMADTNVREEVSELSKDATIETVNAALDVLREEQKTCILNVSAINIAAQKLAASAASETQISKSIIDTNNRLRALDAVATIQAIAFSALIVQAGSIITMHRLQDINSVDQGKIRDFDVLVYKVRAHVIDIKKIMDDTIIPFVRSGVVAQSPYSANLSNVVDLSSDAGAVVGAMAFFMNTAEEFRTKVVEVVNKHNFIQRTFAKCMQMVEGFSNSLPNKVDSEDITKLIEGGDYDTALIKSALEPEILVNQRKFASERSSFDSGGGVPSVLDHDNDINPWVGIFGRPNYKKSNGESIEEDNKLFPLKQIPSNDPDNLMREHTARFSLT